MNNQYQYNNTDLSKSPNSRYVAEGYGSGSCNSSQGQLKNPPTNESIKMVHNTLFEHNMLKAFPNTQFCRHIYRKKKMSGSQMNTQRFSPEKRTAVQPSGESYTECNTQRLKPAHNSNIKTEENSIKIENDTSVDHRNAASTFMNDNSIQMPQGSNNTYAQNSLEQSSLMVPNLDKSMFLNIQQTPVKGDMVDRLRINEVKKLQYQLDDSNNFVV